MVNDFIFTVADMRKALRGLSGTATIRVRVPEKGKGNHNIHIQKFVYDKEWKDWMIVTTEI